MFFGKKCLVLCIQCTRVFSYICADSFCSFSAFGPSYPFLHDSIVESIPEHKEFCLANISLITNKLKLSYLFCGHAAI